MSYLLTLVVFFGIGTILAMSLNLVMGYTGLVSVAHGGLMGVGAYGAAWFALNAGLNMTWAMVVGGAIAAIIGLLFALATAQVSGDEFILASFAFQMVLVEAISRWTSVTRGTYGLSGIPRPVVAGTPLADLTMFVPFVIVVTGLCAAVLLRLARSPFGLALRGSRESIPSMQSLGRNTTRLKLMAFSIAALFAGIAGALSASMVGFIHPSSFSVMISIIVIAYLLIGGLGNMAGAAVGVAVLLAIPEIISASGIVPTQMIGPMERVLYGLILMAFVWFRPQGLLPERPILSVKRLLASGEVRLPEDDPTSAPSSPTPAAPAPAERVQARG